MEKKSYSDCWRIKYIATWHNHIVYIKELRKFGRCEPSVIRSHS